MQSRTSDRRGLNKEILFCNRAHIAGGGCWHTGRAIYFASSKPIVLNSWFLVVKYSWCKFVPESTWIHLSAMHSFPRANTTGTWHERILVAPGEIDPTNSSSDIYTVSFEIPNRRSTRFYTLSHNLLSLRSKVFDIRSYFTKARDRHFLPCY